MAEQPARLARLARKGRLAPGYDADMVIFAPDEPFTDATDLHHKNPITPYAGRRLTGVVRNTFLRGVPVDGKVAAGRLLRSGAA